jgi:serine/threonine protein kinase/tetratricopeptide (TPR) repeat protein
MPALLSGPAYDPALADNIYATTRIDGPLPVHSPTSGEKSGLIDQAYSEYRNLCAAGVEVDPDAFCARFPAYQTSLRRLVEVHRELDANPDLLRSLNRWPVPGDRFHGFQLEHELGRGAFARVFLAREVDIGNRQVVVKVSLHADDEANTLGKVQHPNVAQIHSAPKDDETGFSIVCMPFLGGATLLSVIESITARKTLPSRADFLLTAARDDRFPADSAAAPARALRNGSYLDGVLYIGERLASALAYVHERGILHRDLKPSNVVLCPNGQPVLIDFNLAYDRSITEHRLGGTLPYMPPEQLDALTRKRTAEPVPADNRSDLYALGVLMYEMLAGAHPFGPVPIKLKTEDARDFLLGRQRKGPRPLRARNRSIDPAVDALIVRCLSHDPAGRPATAREMVAELRRLQAPIRRARRWVVAHAKSVAVAGVLATSGTAFGVDQVAKMPSAAAVHKQKADVLSGNGEYAAAAQEYAESLASNPDQPEVKLALSQMHLKLGDDLYKDGKVTDAIANYQRALIYDDTHGDVNLALSRAYQKLGAALYRDGKYLAAIDNYNRALHYGDKQPHGDKQPALYAARGRAYQKLGKFGAAVSDYQKANPKTDGRAAASIGYCFSMRSDSTDAATWYQAAIAAGYANAAVLNNLSHGLARSGKFADAESKASDALELSPSLRAAFYNRGMARVHQWKKNHDPSLALDGLQDLREAINHGVTTANAGYFAAILCAAVLHDRLGDPKADPLYADGAAFLKMAVENGYSRECIGNSPDDLKCVTQWAEQLPQDIKVEIRPNGLDDNIRLVDPVDD